MKAYHEKAIDEILQLIKDNLILLYNFKDDSLADLREYCIKNNHTRYKPIYYSDLIHFTIEAISEINNTSFLYDFRDLE